MKKDPRIRIVARAPSCRNQLTLWVKNPEEIQFAIDQLNQYHAPWALKEVRSGTGAARYAVFVPEEKDSDLL